MEAITLSLANNKMHLILTSSDKTRMNSIIALLTPFKECGEKLASEKNVSISLIIPLFETLKTHLSPFEGDNYIITDMKRKMLDKLENRYSNEQIKILKICTLLDVRHKNEKYVKSDNDELSNQV